MDPADKEPKGTLITGDILDFARKRSEVEPRYVASLKALSHLKEKRKRAATLRAELRRAEKHEGRGKNGRLQDTEETDRVQSQTRVKQADDEPEDACSTRRRRRRRATRPKRRRSCARRRPRRRSCPRRRRRSASRRRRRRSCRQRRRRARPCGCSK